MNTDNKLLNKLVKKHKKLFETYTINPGAYQLNNNSYLLANYYKGNKLSGCAVISPQSDSNKNEYSEAFDSLLEHAELTTLILKHAGDRADSNMDSFLTIKNFLENILSEVELTEENKIFFENSLNEINIIVELQERLIELYKTFYSQTERLHTGEKDTITRRDIDEAANYLGEVGYIQYRQLVANYNSISKFKHIININNPEINKYIRDDVKRYLVEFSQHETRQKKRIDSISYQPHMDRLTKKEHIEVEKKNFYQNLERTNVSSRRDLRFP